MVDTAHFENVRRLIERLENHYDFFDHHGHDLATNCREWRELRTLALAGPRLPESGSVLQPWVMALPLRYQGTLLTCVRGCDLEPKQWHATGFAESQGRRLTGFIRWCFMVPADPREVDIPGAFFQSTPPGSGLNGADKFKPSEFGHLPLHWYTHVMHALEVIAYCHPVPAVRETAFGLYRQMCHGLHLPVETAEALHKRLTEDRLANGTVVS